MYTLFAGVFNPWTQCFLTSLLSTHNVNRRFFFCVHNVYWRFSLYTMLLKFFYVQNVTEVFFLCTQYLMTFNLRTHYLLTYVILLFVGPTVRRTPDVRYGGWTRDGWPADLHADGDGRRQRPVQLWHLYLHPSGSSF